MFLLFEKGAVKLTLQFTLCTGRSIIISNLAVGSMLIALGIYTWMTGFSSVKYYFMPWLVCVSLSEFRCDTDNPIPVSTQLVAWPLAPCLNLDSDFFLTGWWCSLICNTATRRSLTIARQVMVLFVLSMYPHRLLIESMDFHSRMSSYGRPAAVRLGWKISIAWSEYRLIGGFFFWVDHYP